MERAVAGLHVGRFLQGRKLAPLPLSLVKDGAWERGLEPEVSVAKLASRFTKLSVSLPVVIGAF